MASASNGVARRFTGGASKTHPSTVVGQVDHARPLAAGIDDRQPERIAPHPPGLPVDTGAPAAMICHLHGDQIAGSKIGGDARLARSQPVESGWGQGGVFERCEKGLQLRWPAGVGGETRRQIGRAHHMGER